MVAENQKEKDEKRKLEESIKNENLKNTKYLQDTVTLCLQQDQKIQNLTKENLHLSDENKRLKGQIEETKAGFKLHSHNPSCLSRGDNLKPVSRKK